MTLALQEDNRWRFATLNPPPRGRGIWISGKVIFTDGPMVSAEPFEGYAGYARKTKDWQDVRGMSIRLEAAAELVIHQWMECEDRAAMAPFSEMRVTGDVHFDPMGWSDDGALGPGYYAGFEIFHRLTYVTIESERRGPFATGAEALLTLSQMLRSWRKEVA